MQITDMAKKKSTSLSWDAFQSLGNPENAPEFSETEGQPKPATSAKKDRVRVYLEKKGRRGKSVTLIKGLTLDQDDLSALAKNVKSSCGVGGGVEGEHIMVQGDQRLKVVKYFQELGYTDVKNAGS